MLRSWVALRPFEKQSVCLVLGQRMLAVATVAGKRRRVRRKSVQEEQIRWCDLIGVLL